MSAWNDMGSDRRLEAVRAMAADGWSGGLIARNLGATRSAVMGLCRRNGIRLLGMVRVPVARKEPPPAAVIPEPPKTGHVGLMDLRTGVCRYPVEGEGKHTLFCGGSVEAGVYCDAHRAVAYVERSNG